jgi:hypothetical protein
VTTEQNLDCSSVRPPGLLQRLGDDGVVLCLAKRADGLFEQPRRLRRSLRLEVQRRMRPHVLRGYGLRGRRVLRASG